MGTGVSVIPGNHDVYIPSCSEALLTRLWAPYLPDPEGPWPRLQLRGAVALITVNSGHAAPPAFATGGLGTAQREHLGALLRAAGAAGYARVLMIHHAPGPSMDKWRKRHVDARALASLLAATGAELILHGHCHESLSRSLPAPKAIPVPARPRPPPPASGDAARRIHHLAVTSARPRFTLQDMGSASATPELALETRLKRPGVTPRFGQLAARAAKRARTVAKSSRESTSTAASDVHGHGSAQRPRALVRLRGRKSDRRPAR